jgi:hypothetical protein
MNARPFSGLGLTATPARTFPSQTPTVASANHHQQIAS